VWKNYRSVGGVLDKGRAQAIRCWRGRFTEHWIEEVGAGAKFPFFSWTKGEKSAHLTLCADGKEVTMDLFASATSQGAMRPGHSPEKIPRVGRRARWRQGAA